MTNNIDAITKENELLKNELELITTIYSKLNMNSDLDQIITEIIHTLREYIDFDAFNIALINEHGYMEFITPVPSTIFKFSHIDKELWRDIANRKYDLKNSKIWICKVARENKEYYYPEFNFNEMEPVERAGIQALGLKSIYYLPLKLEEKVLGTVMFGNLTNTMYISDFEKDLIRRRLVLIARIIESLKLYKEIENKNNELQKSRKLIQEDLLLAKRIQTNFIPPVAHSCEKVDLTGSYIPMIEVGGDYYDFCPHPQGIQKGFGTIITDASGHGVSAAFITSMVKMVFKNDFVSENVNSPAAILSYINKAIIDKTAGNFVTAMYCYCDLENMKAKIACGGHNPLYIINKVTGKFKEIHPKGRILSFLDDPVFDEIEIDINHNDRFFFYTDGLTEAINENNEEFEEIFIELIKESNNLSAKDLVDKIIAEVKEHVSGLKKDSFDDDVAIIVADFH